MAPLKFEDNIRDKLEEREIQPSADSWNQLAEKLDQQQSRTPSKFWAYGIAASITGIILLSTLFIKNSTIDANSEPFIVNTKIPKDKDPDTIFDTQKIEEDLNTIEVVSAKTEKEAKKKTEEKIKISSAIQKDTPSEKPETKNDIQPKENAVITAITNHKTITEEVINSKKDQLSPDKKIQITPEIIESKIANVLEQVKQLKDKNIPITEEGIDALLQKAQQEITNEQFINSNTNKVNAMTLLQDVETELDETFKERVLEALKAGFQKVRSAVAERDQY